MKLKNLAFNVLAGTTLITLVGTTKDANAANFHVHCAVISYVAPSGNIPLDSPTKKDFMVDIIINVAAANGANCPGGEIGKYEISDLTSIQLGLGGQGKWDVTIGNNVFKNQFFSSPDLVPFTLPTHQQKDSIEFNFIDNIPDILKVSFKAVDVTSETAIVKFRDPQGNHYYRVPEPSTIIGTGLAVGLGILSRKQKKTKSKD